MPEEKQEPDLIEEQGVNAGPSVDAEENPPPTPDLPDPPDRPATAGTLYDEQVGLPGQKPGYPGQQNSVDTS
ncbi:hypothetical protein [Actinomadura hibisca]|uniref:hypothetical protein n=1 Tax=Actinomadura hibisca TaxID=68565 RepID=UPI000A01A856|nr:hypothetical protein [Actinomadura hibisca]